MKNPKTLTKKQLDEYTLDWRKHNKTMKQKHMHDLVFSCLDDFISYRRGKLSKVKDTSRKDYVPKPVQRFDDQNQRIKSLTDYGQLPSESSLVRQERLTYSGDYIVGIATMHKSNMVHIGRGDDPNSYATMRRG